ncbi:MAG TPA: endonuclease domain-containing protein [Armatimonadota bacterium]
MSTKFIVFGPHDPAKRARAHEMRLNMTEAEQTLWQRLKGHQVAGLNFRRQQVVEGFIVDFYCHRVCLAIEVDGTVHDKRQEYDRQRDAVLGGRGITVLRFTNDQVFRRIESVVAEIAAAGAISWPPDAG